MDSRTGSPWNRPEVAAGFTRTPPNPELLRFAEAARERLGSGRVALDLGCGAGRNAVPLAERGWRVLGIDTSAEMAQAACRWAHQHRLRHRVHVVAAAMDGLPVSDDSCDLIVAHGIWNLAGSDAEFRRALHEAARAARPGAGLFVFTFSRATLPPQARPLAGESFVYTEFSGHPQCFLTAEQLIEELTGVSFVPDPGVPLVELNRPRTAALQLQRVPVIYQGAFRYEG